jgi:hypothetical protein
MHRSRMSLGIVSVAGLIGVIASVGLLMGQGTPRSTSPPRSKKFTFALPHDLKGSLVQARDVQFTPTHAAFTNHTLDQYPDLFNHLGKNYATFFMDDNAAVAHIHLNGKAFRQDLVRYMAASDPKGLYSIKGPDNKTHWFRVYQEKPHADGSAEGWQIEWPGDPYFIRDSCQIGHVLWKDNKLANDPEPVQLATWVQLGSPASP